MLKSKHLSSPAAYARLLKWTIHLQETDLQHTAMMNAIRRKVFDYKHAVELDAQFLEHVAHEVFACVAQEPKLFLAVASK